MINLKIDPEFQSQIPPLTDDEFKQLEGERLSHSPPHGGKVSPTDEYPRGKTEKMREKDERLGIKV